MPSKRLKKHLALKYDINPSRKCSSLSRKKVEMLWTIRLNFVATWKKLMAKKSVKQVTISHVSAQSSICETGRPIILERRRGI
jgi:hypothetical protein